MAMRLVRALKRARTIRESGRKRRSRGTQR
jgi:hypothetical protein